MSAYDAFAAIRSDELNLEVLDNDKTILNQENEEGFNLLMYAISQKKFEIAKLLLEKDIDINHKDKTLNNVLHILSKISFNVEMASLLIKHGCDINAKNAYGNQPLWDAVFNVSKKVNKGENELVKYLIEHGANPMHKNNNNKSPLSFIEEKEKKDIELLNILRN